MHCFICLSFQFEFKFFEFKFELNCLLLNLKAFPFLFPYFQPSPSFPSFPFPFSPLFSARPSFLFLFSRPSPTPASPLSPGRQEGPARRARLLPPVRAGLQLKESGPNTRRRPAAWPARQGRPAAPINSARDPLARPLGSSSRRSLPQTLAPPPLELHPSSDSTRSHRSATSPRRPRIPGDPPQGEQRRVPFFPSLSCSHAAPIARRSECPRAAAVRPASITVAPNRCPR